MREILFRGKRLDNGEWIEGYFVKFEGREIPEIYTGWNCYTLTPECYGIEPSTVGQYTGLTDRNGKKIFEGDIVKYYHHKKSLVPVTDIKPEENHYDRDEGSGLPLAYRTTKIIRYKGHVEIHPIMGMTINLNNRCQWWRNMNYEDDPINSDRLEVIGNIHDNPELMTPSSKRR